MYRSVRVSVQPISAKFAVEVFFSIKFSFFAPEIQVGAPKIQVGIRQQSRHHALRGLLLLTLDRSRRSSLKLTNPCRNREASLTD